MMRRLYGRRGWTTLGICSVIAFVVFPLLHLVVPASSAFHVSTFWVTLAGKIMCYAMVAVALDLVWGYAGILSLGHGLFFALGGYGMGMYLMRQIGREGQYQADLPDFMVFLDWKEFPWQWWNTEHFWWAVLLVILVPGLLALVFGYFAFRSRVKGVYFSIITQALTFAAMLLFFRNNTGFGGNNGFTDFKRILGFNVTSPETRMALFCITAFFLMGTLLVARWIVTSKFGRVRPVITSIIVVLPAPVGPITQRSSPASIASDRLFSARKPSKLTEIPSRYSTTPCSAAALAASSPGKSFAFISSAARRARRAA